MGVTNTDEIRIWDFEYRLVRTNMVIIKIKRTNGFPWSKCYMYNGNCFLWKLICQDSVLLSAKNTTMWQEHSFDLIWFDLTHWGRVTQLCVVKLTIIDSDNGLSPGRRQAIIWTNAGILLIGPLGTNFIEILIGIQTFSLKKCTWRCRLRNGVHFVSVSMC